MKILIISRTVWDESNSFGNTFSSLFKGMKNVELANIYCGNGEPTTKIANRFFQINEKAILKNIINKNYPSGKEVFRKTNKQKDNSKISETYSFAKRKRWQILFWMRDLIWKTGKWKSKELINFIDSYKPDIIFSPYYYSIYMSDIQRYVQKHLEVPMVSYVSDDIYTMKQFSISPLFWMDRLIVRKKIRNIAEINNFLYVISDKQKKEYSEKLHPDCRILTKGANFDIEVEKKNISKPLIIVYTGNISSGRWKTLSEIGEAINIINKNEQRIKLKIYTVTPMTKSMKKSLTITGAIELKGSVQATEIEQIQINADVLLHCESFELKEKLKVRLSFSTKLVDYFSRKRCIFAVGDKNLASIEYLLQNDAAIVATNKQQIFDKLNEIVGNKEKVNQYAEKAWECGKKNHQIDYIQENLYNDLKMLTEDKSNENNSN